MWPRFRVKCIFLRKVSVIRVIIVFSHRKRQGYVDGLRKYRVLVRARYLFDRYELNATQYHIKYQYVFKRWHNYPLCIGCTSARNVHRLSNHSANLFENKTPKYKKMKSIYVICNQWCLQWIRQDAWSNSRHNEIKFIEVCSWMIKITLGKLDSWNDIQITYRLV